MTQYYLNLTRRLRKLQKRWQGNFTFHLFFFFFYPPADGEKYSFSSPHFHVFSYASCVDLTQLLSQPNSSWRTRTFSVIPWKSKRVPGIFVGKQLLRSHFPVVFRRYWALSLPEIIAVSIKSDHVMSFPCSWRSVRYQQNSIQVGIACRICRAKHSAR